MPCSLAAPMAKTNGSRRGGNGRSTGQGVAGSGGELHQQATGDNVLTTNQGVPISDDQNTLPIGTRGPGTPVVMQMGMSSSMHLA